MKKVIGPLVLVVAGAMLGWSGARAGDEAKLPDAVKAAIEKAFPGAKLGDSERETLRVVVYEVDVKSGESALTLKVGRDGTILEVEGVVTQADLPAPVAQALTSAASGATIGKIERAEERARLQLVALPTPAVSYEAKITKDGKRRELAFDAAGKALDDDDDDGDDDDDDGEEDDDDGDDDDHDEAQKGGMRR